VTPTSGLTETDIARILGEAEQFADEDAKKRELAEVKNSAETLIYTTERALEEYGTMLAEGDRKAIEEDLRYAKQVTDIAEISALRDALRRLEASAHKIAEMMYADAAGGSGGQEGQT